MFTFKKRIYLIIFILFLALTLVYKEEYLAALGALIGILFIIYDYFRHGTILVAFKRIKYGKFDQARVMLEEIKYYKRLSNKYKGFFHFGWGLVYFNTQEYELAEQHFMTSLHFNLQTPTNKTLVYIGLGKINVVNNRYIRAVEYLTKAKELTKNELLLKEVDKIEQEIKQVSI